MAEHVGDLEVRERVNVELAAIAPTDFTLPLKVGSPWRQRVETAECWRWWEPELFESPPIRSAGFQPT